MSEATWEVVEITTGVGRVPKWQVRGPGFSATFRDEGVARLIAAAPDLFAACEAWAAYFDELDAAGVDVTDPLLTERRKFHGRRIAATRAAIAKARGTP